jgi:tetratricopeptide (TPR) repeat protein
MTRRAERRAMSRYFEGASMDVRVAYPSSPASIKPAVPSNPLEDAFLRLKEAEELRLQRKLDRAQKICESLLREHPDYAGALHTLGLVLADKDNYQLALNYLVRAAMLHPRSWMTLTALSGVYLALGAPEMAAHALEQARAIKPDDSNVLATLGEVYREEREYELARDAYRQALAIEPDLAPAATGLGWVCSYMGEDGEAVEVFERLVERGARSLEVLHALTSLPASLVSVDVLAEMEKVVREPTLDKPIFESALAFIRATALDKAGRPAEAWQQLVPANRAVFAAMQRERQQQREREKASLKQLLDAPSRTGGNKAGDGQTISLFILGPSRSGKTSMEKLVSALAGVKRGYENPIVEKSVRRTFQSAALLASGSLGHLPPQLDPMFREIYQEELARRAGSAPVFTNTHPVRIYDVARMVSLFHDVRFIFVKRDVDDVVLRIFMLRYHRGNAYAYDLKSAREHVVWYHRMMDLLAEKFPDIVRVVRYEDMVTDPPAALRAAADLCGLPMVHGSLPAIGDDRGSAEPYRQLMAAEPGS